MPNSLTGDNEAVFQISVKQIVGVLATMHQNRIDPSASTTFAHGGSIRIGDPPAGLFTEAARFRNWVTDITVAQASVGAASEPRTVLFKHTPPGMSTRMTAAWQELEAARVAAADPAAVRGLVEFQVSTPMISFAPGVADAVTIRANVRARYLPDPGFAQLPEPIHGEVRAVYLIQPKTLPDGRKALGVKVSPDDTQLQFVAAPGSGLTPAEAGLIADQVRKALRRHFAPADIELPDDFAFSKFKALGTGETIALPVQLSGAPVPPGGLSSITTDLRAGHEFALAVSREFVQLFLDQMAESIESNAASRQVVFTVTFVEITYRIAADVTFAWHPGTIEIAGRLDLITASDAPNGFITFKQHVALVLDVAAQQISVVPTGDPDVDESWFIPHDKAVSEVVKARDQALPGAGAALTNTFRSAAAKLETGLRRFDKYARVSLAAVEVTPDGIVVRGSIKASGRIEPVVQVREVDAGSAFSAFGSWIPGGWIETYSWSWVEMIHPIPWANKTSYAPPESHRFVLPKPAGFVNAPRICLAFEGWHVTADGDVSGSVTAGETCGVSAHEPILTVPPGWAKLYAPIWIPDPPPFNFVVRDRIAAHVDLASESRVPGRLGVNTLVYFTGGRVDRPLDMLESALSALDSTERPLSVLLVLPQGQFERTRSELEEALGGSRERFGAQLLITEDYGREWSRTFGASDAPGAHLMDSRGEFAWRHEGMLEHRTLAAALHDRLLPAPAAQAALIRLAVQSGEPAPDVALVDNRGHQTTLRRLRGKRVLLSFCQSWSAPCIRELQRLQRLHEAGSEAIIIAVIGDDDAAVFEAMSGSHGLTFGLVHDREHAIGAQYGVRCWPTTVSISEEGLVDRIQFGLSHERHSEHQRG